MEKPGEYDPTWIQIFKLCSRNTRKPVAIIGKVGFNSLPFVILDPDTAPVRSVVLRFCGETYAAILSLLNILLQNQPMRYSLQWLCIWIG